MAVSDTPFLAGRGSWLTMLAVVASAGGTLLSNTSLAASPPLVALDAGHYADKPGTHSASGVAEIEFNQRFVAHLDQQLRKLGVATQLIDQVPNLQERARSASHARLLVSIHHDSTREEYLPQVNRFAGYSLYVSRRQSSKDFDRALACSRAISRELLATGRPIATHHAEGVAGEHRTWVDQSLGVYRYDDLIILHTAEVPALLLEVAVIPNTAEEKLAADETWVDHQSAAVAAGIQHCLSD